MATVQVLGVLQTVQLSAENFRAWCCKKMTIYIDWVEI